MSSGGDDPAGEEERPEARGLCPHCGAVCEYDQEYCLSCGARLYDDEGGLPLLESWRYSLPALERSWTWPVAIALVVAVLATAVAILSTRSSHTSTLVEPGPKVHPPTTMVETASTTIRTTTTTTTTTKARTTTRKKPPKPLVDANGLIAWPGSPAYTVVLASIPVSSGKEGARQKAVEALNAGLGDVGVLKSSDYSSLHPGYYVVFSGVFKTESAALSHIAAARKAGFASAYQKRIAT